VLSYDRYIMREAKKKGNLLQSNPLGVSANLMCRMLSSDYTLEGEELLEEAINNLDRMDAIIFFNDLENGIRRVFSELGLFVPRSIPHKNTTSDRKTQRQYNIIQPITDELIEQIREKNSLDVRLYEYALMHFR